MKSPNILSFIVSCISHFKLLIAGQFFIGIIWAVNMSLSPYLLKIMLDRIPGIRPEAVFSELALPAGLYIFMTALMSSLWRLYNFISLHFRPGLRHLIALKLMGQMMEHSYHFYQNQFAGGLANRIKDVMSGVPDILRIVIDRFFCHSIALVIATYTMWQASPEFALGLVIWIILYLIVSIKFSSRAKLLSDQAAEVRSGMIGHIVDMLGNMSSIRLFNNKAGERKSLDSVLQKAKEAEQNRDWFFLKMFSFQSVSFVIYQGVSLFLLILGLQKGTLTPGDFALVLMLNISIIEAVWPITEDISQFAERLGDITQGLRIVQSPIEVQNKENAEKLEQVKGQITFNKIKFHYKDSHPLFEDLSVTIVPGQKVGLVGYSGSGKTSFVNLILRLFDVTAGAILIDGQDVRDVTQESLRQAIGMIPQDPSLFHRSLEENIGYGLRNASLEEIIKASRQASAHEFISALPEGYNSLVGERGIKLSGGQRQRIAIARAFLKNAPILILDEATSQLDSVTENYIQNSLWHLMKGKTTLVIAHRLSTLLRMDRILVFDQGKIVEDGSHTELLTAGGLYKSLWEAQIGGFLPTTR